MLCHGCLSKQLPLHFADEVRQYGSEIVVHPNGKWLYVSNRGRGPLLVYDIDTASGQLKQTVVSFHFSINFPPGLTSAIVRAATPFA